MTFKQAVSCLGVGAIWAASVMATIALSCVLLQFAHNTLGMGLIESAMGFLGLAVCCIGAWFHYAANYR